MNLLFVKNYNNYFNSIIKHYLGTIYNLQQDYETRYYANINFNPNNDINTSQIINWDMNWMPDYLFISEDGNNIDSSWFVINYVRTRNGQYNFSLKRDTINDFYDQVKQSTCIINKAKLNKDNKLIYNSEGTSCNQVKTQQIQLKDKSEIPWIVGYLVQDDKSYPEAASLTVSNEENEMEAVSWVNLNFTPIADTTTTIVDVTTNKSTILIINFYRGNSKWSAEYHPYTNTIEYKFQTHGSTLAYPIFSCPASVSAETLKEAILSCCQSLRNQIISNFPSDCYSIEGDDIEEDINKYTQEFLSKNSLNQYYNISISKNKKTTETQYNVFEELTSNFKNLLKSKISNLSFYKNNLSFEAKNIISYNVTTTATNYGNYSTHIPSTRVHLNDSPYDMFCIPYGEITGEQVEYEGWFFNTNYTKDVYTGIFKTNKNAAMAIAREIANKYKGNTSVLYDIQLLPYCPCPELLDTTGDIYNLVNRANNNYEYVPIMKKTASGIEPVSIMFWCRRSQLTFNITNTYQPSKSNMYETQSINLTTTYNDGVGAYYGSVSLPDNVEIVIKYLSIKPSGSFGNTMYWESETAQTITGTISYYDADIAKKVLNETELCRLVSPNWNGQFEYNPIKNDGVDYFRVDLRYKPYTPYIHVAPNFKGLYGKSSFNDARGLICNGDFSIDTTSDAFAQYELQNKNYQNIFDRQIQNMDFNNKLGLVKDIVSASAGAVSAGVGVGALTGNPIAGIAMGTASAIGGAADVAINQATRKEQRQYTIDNFNMQIGNVKALPQSLSSVSSINPNNQIFPILEAYTSTNEEQLALKEQIKLRGMTVNVVGTLGEYITERGDFISATIIKIEDVESNAIAEDISNELQKGVYI